MTTRVTASAPGKVNLVLFSARQDHRGYHPLYSIFETLDLRETVTVSAAKSLSGHPGTTDGITVHTVVSVADSLTNARLSEQINDLDPQQNLAVRAVSLIRSIAGEKGRGTPNVDIEVVKRIPIAGGMAGGSADAAAALVAANEFFHTELEPSSLERLGRRLGADVPSCLTGGMSLGLGYGDHMRRLDDGGTPRHHWVMLMAHEGLSTPAVFAQFDSQYRGRDTLAQTLLPEHEHIASSPAEDIATVLHNDLEATVRDMRPDLDATFRAVSRTDALGALLSGSGPTIAVLARDREHAQVLQGRLSRDATVAGAVVTSGPAQPAKVENT